MATFIWQRRGRFTLGTIALVAAWFIFISTRSSIPALAVSGGSPYSVPVVVDSNPDPNIVETTIVAEPAAVDIGNGVTASVLTFNGTVPGPEFRLKVGDTVIVHFENNIAHDTGIHWHGIELANASDGTPLSQNQVPPGDTFLYKFQVTRPGIYWYHPHHHSSTNQVFKGLYGSIIVEDPNEAALVASGAIPGPADTLTLALSDITVCEALGSNPASMYENPPDVHVPPHVSGADLVAQTGQTPLTLCETAPIDEDGNPRGPFAAGEVPNIQKLIPDNQPINEGNIVLTNGKNVGGRAGTPLNGTPAGAPGPGAVAAGASTYDVLAGQGLRLQLGNTATTRFFRLILTDSTGVQVPLVRIGGQGGLLDVARVEGGTDAGGYDFKYTEGEILLDPGDRADVVVAIPALATGVLTLWTQDFSRTGGGFARLPTVPVAHFNVTGPSGSVYTITPGVTQLRAATGDPQEVIGAPTGTLLDPGAFAPAKPGLPGAEIQLTAAPGASLGVNGFQGHHDFAGNYIDVPHEDSARYAKIGDILELTVKNTTAAHHPFHLHGFSIQPVSLTANGGAGPDYTFPYAEFRDNIDVPSNYTLTYRVRLDDRPLMDGATPGGGLGRWVFHCHIFFHATFGMISEFVVSAPDGKERPYVNADDTLVEGNAGDMFTVNGTYKDTDGEAVTLAASIGSIVDNGVDGAGFGHWTWTHTGVGGEGPFVYITATDTGGRQDIALFAINVNGPPIVTVDDAAGNEGAAIAISGTVTDPDGDPVTHSWSFTAGAGVDAGATCAIGAPNALSTTITCTDDGTYTITLTASDGVNPPVAVNGTLAVANVAPTVSITSPPTGSLYIVGTTVPVSASIVDPGSNDTLSCTFNWDGGGPDSVVAAVAGTCASSNLFAAAGVYTVTVTGSDDDGGIGTPASVMIIVYDPSAGFVTAGGTIDSLPGAYVPDASLTGKASFGLVAKYHKGATVPVGNTEFTFHAAAFTFHASVYEWLVVAGAKAQFRGTGTVNGTGTYGFLLTVTDGALAGGGGVDKFRIKVWDTSSGDTLVYDNVLGASEDIDLANPQALQSGSVVIHKPK